MPADVRAAVGRPIRAAGGTATLTAAAGEDGKPALRRFSGVAYSGAPMKPMGWGIPIIVDLAGVKYPTSQNRPAFRQHDAEQIVGHTDGITVGEGIAVEGPFSGQAEHVAKVTEPADNGFQWQMSIGATPTRLEFLEAGATTTVNGREVTGPMDIARETDLSEVSFVPLGADGDTSAVIATKGGRAVYEKAMIRAARSAGNVKAAKYNDDEIDKMSDDEAKAALKKCMAEGDEPDDKEKKAKAAEDEEKKAKAAEDDKDKPADAKAAARAFNAAYRAELAAERTRVNEITARCQKYAGINAVKLDDGKTVDLITHAIEANWTPDQAELVALRSARPTGPHFHTPTTPVLSEAVIEAAVFDALGSQFQLFDSEFYRFGDGGQRRVPERTEKKITAELNARYTDQVRQAAHTHFRGRMGLQQLLTTLAAANGYRGPATFNDPNGWGEVAEYLGHNRSIRADGPSTVNTPGTLANVQNKLMMQGYLFTEQAYMDVVQVIPVKDLKPTKSVQLFGDFVFKPLNPAGEIAHASVGDNAYANQAKLQARMITLELQYIINDDLGMFGQLPMMLGRGWGLRVNDTVWGKLLVPGGDGGGTTNFFDTSHTITGQSGNANKQTGATASALSSAGLQAAITLFNKQVDPAGQPLGVDPEILLYPPELDVAARELMNAQFIIMAGLASTSAATKQANTNIFQGRFRPVMSRYLSNPNYTGYSTTGWYLLANPSVLPVIQIAALNGQMTPTIQTAGQDWQFNMLGISMRGWGGFDANMQNFRGGVQSTGA